MVFHSFQQDCVNEYLLYELNCINFQFCGIDGDWVCLILNFSDGFQFRLRPIYMAYEDRENIIRYIVE